MQRLLPLFHIFFRFLLRYLGWLASCFICCYFRLAGYSEENVRIARLAVTVLFDALIHLLDALMTQSPDSAVSSSTELSF